MASTRPGRSCPRHYRYSPAVFSRAADLKAQSLYRLRRDGEDRVVYSEPIPLGQRLRDIATLSDGTLVLWTDDAQLLFLSVDRAKLATNHRPVPW